MKKYDANFVRTNITNNVALQIAETFCDRVRPAYFALLSFRFLVVGSIYTLPLLYHAALRGSPLSRNEHNWHRQDDLTCVLIIP